MAPDPAVEKASETKPRSKIRSLMVIVALVALLLGFFTQTRRAIREHDASQARYNSWMAEVEKANATLTPGGKSFKTMSNLFEISRTCTTTLLTPTRKWITIQAKFDAGPVSTVRKVTFDASGRSVTWPFEDVENGRKIDLKAEFPEAFR